jgi:hypothetical protein
MEDKDCGRRARVIDQLRTIETPAVQIIGVVLTGCVCAVLCGQ